MGIISKIVNRVNCGGSNIAGTGGAFCPIDIDTPKTIALTKKGLKIPANTNLSLAYFKELQQKEKAYIFKGVVNFADKTAENEMGTYESTGEKYLKMKSPYEMDFTFDRGLYSYKALTNFESNGAYDLWIFDVKNDLFCASNSDSSIRGLDAGMISIGKYGIGKDNSQMMTVQINRTDFDDNVSWITNEELGFSASQELDGFNDIELLIVAPVVGSTTIKFIATAKAANKNVALEGLVLSDLLLKIQGAIVTPTTLTPLTVAGEYTLTVPAQVIGNVITLQLYDPTLIANVIDLDGVLYKSNIANTVVI